MTRVSHHSILTALALTVMTGSAAAQATAGSPPRFRSVTATVALVSELPAPNAAAVVLRRADTYPRDVILLRRADADGGRLAAAVATLLFARQRFGDVATRNGTLVVTDTLGPTAWRQSEKVRADRVVRKLRTETPGPVPGVGSVPNIQLPLRVARVRDESR